MLSGKATAGWASSPDGRGGLDQVAQVHHARDVVEVSGEHRRARESADAQDLQSVARRRVGVDRHDISPGHEDVLQWSLGAVECSGDDVALVGGEAAGGRQHVTQLFLRGLAAPQRRDLRPSTGR